MNVKMLKVNENHALKRWEAISHPDVSKWVFIDLPVSFEKTLDWCKSITDRPDRMDFCFEVDGAVAGFAGIVNIDQKSKVAELYIFLHPSFFSKGLGTVFLHHLIAFGKLELNLRKISLWVTLDNTKAVTFYEKNNFQVEGVLKQHVWFRGSYRDRALMSIFTEDFQVDSVKFYTEVL